MVVLNKDAFGRGIPMQMNSSGWEEMVQQLHGREYQFGLITPASPVHRIEFDAGLSDYEVVNTEQRFGFRFPPDLRSLLQTALPHSPQFPDWRNGNEAALGDWLDQPRQGIV